MSTESMNTADPQVLPMNAPIDPNSITPESFETILPPEPSIWPIASGWYALAGVLVLLLIIGIFFYFQARKKARIKRTALALITAIPTHLSERERAMRAYEIHRQVCLSYYPRYLLAELHSQDWYAFLDDQMENSASLFQKNQHQWQTVLYRNSEVEPHVAEQLINSTHEWVEKALPPSRKQLNRALSFVARTSDDMSNAK